MMLAEQPDCWSYRAGHRMHWIQWNLARESKAVPARVIRIDGNELTLVTDDELTLQWWDHDPERVRAYAARENGRVLLYPRWHAMKIGNGWFNCDTSSIHSMCKPEGDGT